MTWTLSPVVIQLEVIQLRVYHSYMLVFVKNIRDICL
jgi:hypothetical protein